MTPPAFNHTRGDSFETPCEVCALHLRVAALEQDLIYAKRANDAIRGKRDKVSGPWWVSFEAMLSEEERNEIGLSEDRGQALCTTRLAAAYSEARKLAAARLEILTRNDEATGAYVGAVIKLQQAASALAEALRDTKLEGYAARRQKALDDYEAVRL